MLRSTSSACYFRVESFNSCPSKNTSPYCWKWNFPMTRPVSRRRSVGLSVILSCLSCSEFLFLFLFIFGGRRGSVCVLKKIIPDFKAALSVKWIYPALHKHPSKQMTQYKHDYIIKTSLLLHIFIWSFFLHYQLSL